MEVVETSVKKQANTKGIKQLGFTNLPAQKPEPIEGASLDEQLLKDLHKLLLEVSNLLMTT